MPKEMCYKVNAKCLITKLIKSNCESNKNVRLKLIYVLLICLLCTYSYLLRCIYILKIRVTIKNYSRTNRKWQIRKIALTYTENIPPVH